MCNSNLESAVKVVSETITRSLEFSSWPSLFHTAVTETSESTPTDRSMVQDSMKLLVPAYKGSGTGEEETSGGGTVESKVITFES